MSSSSALRAAILIVSETAALDPTTDKGIPALRDVLAAQGAGRWHITDTRIVSDNVLDIQRAVTAWTDGHEPVHLVLTSGGTGFAQKDVTPESWNARYLAVGHSMPVAGVRHNTLILTLPGSPKGAKENLEAVVKQLPHACMQVAGADSRSLHAGGTQKLERDAGVIAQPSSQQSHGGHSCGHHHSHNHGHGHGHHGPRAHTNSQDRPASNDPSAGPTRRYRESPYPMLAVDDAIKVILEQIPKPVAVTSSLDETIVGAVLAEDVTAREAVPAFRASIVDGYAIIAPQDSSQPSTRGIFPVVSVSHAQAGQVPELRPGQVARITTGAPLPTGATSVVMVEDTVLTSTTEDGSEEKEVEVLTDAIQPGENVREVGSDVKAGEIIMRNGEGISVVGGEFGLLASVGTQEVSVYRRPVVGVLSTGDEIVPHDRSGDLQFGEVRDTNRPTLLTAIKSAGYDAVDLGIVSDKPGALEQALRDAIRRVDVIVTSGGVSMGELDLLKPTIERSLGGTIHFGRVSMKPGKPTTFATIPSKTTSDGTPQSTAIFSLPGNPASAVVTFHLFVLPALHYMSGVQGPVGLPRVQVILEHDIKLDPQRAEFHRAVVSARLGQSALYATGTGFQRSSRIGSFKGANALLCLPARKGILGKGETVDALLMARIVADGASGDG